MYEGIKPFINAQNASRARQAERESADAYEAIGEWKAHAAGLKAQIQQRDARISEQDAEIARLKDALALETADVAGRKAQFDAFKTQHPDTSLLVDSGRRFKASGKAKTKARLIYEAAFDKKAREMGIANPAERRVD